MFSHKVPAFRFMGGEMDGIVDGTFELDPMALPDDLVNPECPNDMNSSNWLAILPHANFSAPLIGPYPENQSLKPSWSEQDFTRGQIWAVYSGTDFTPRQYARINDVVLVNQVCVTFLEPQPVLDHEIQWHRENLPIVSGIFKVGRTTLNLEMSWFSHSVKCQRSMTKPFYKIYPMKGEIWAMYKNWNNKWKQSDYKSYQCWIVEILSDFTEEKCMRIVRLVEVKGCMTFFQRQRYDDFELTRTVSQADMLAFSHRIPAFRVPGVRKYSIPEASWHLEPDALPPKLSNMCS
uniref:DUF3444 domain-containing protein n=1 Tax=Nelumbo nucifera TaxID=4432 RepID=A0A822Y8M5_NELNU|nr:TPA_asm: hypothetical protein HUJ06_009265 [Nelumbo nucifera]